MTVRRVYTLPGWLGSGPGHWQTLWEDQGRARRVEQADWHWPRRGDWMARLDETLLDDAALEHAPALVAAHSLGCHLVAAWACHSRHTARVGGALLVAPPDLDRPELPPPLYGWRPALRQPLPFPCIVVCSNDDPYASADASQRLAADWGARFVLAGACGHLNADSGLGDWPDARAWLDDLGRSGPSVAA